MTYDFSQPTPQLAVQPVNAGNPANADEFISDQANAGFADVAPTVQGITFTSNDRLVAMVTGKAVGGRGDTTGIGAVTGLVNSTRTILSLTSTRSRRSPRTALRSPIFTRSKSFPAMMILSTASPVRPRPNSSFTWTASPGRMHGGGLWSAHRRCERFGVESGGSQRLYPGPQRVPHRRRAGGRSVGCNRSARPIPPDGSVFDLRNEYHIGQLDFNRCRPDSESNPDTAADAAVQRHGWFRFFSPTPRPVWCFPM